MKFFDREEEIATLRKIRENAEKNAQFTVLTGRRRIGETSLERYFRDKAKESKRYTLRGRWWDRKGEHEIDMIAANEIDQKVEVYEIKRNRKNINFTMLEEKTQKMLSGVHIFNGYEVDVKGLDLHDM